MLRRFKVSNFKSFKDELNLDLSETNGYEFNKNCIKNNIVNCALVYGYNGCGKSNLGLAIFDIIEHLTDKNRDERKYSHYLNAYNKDVNYASFYYEFLIDDMIVKYEYKKTDYKTLIFERFSINDEELVLFNRLEGNQFTSNFKGAETLNKLINDSQLSALRYLKNNTVLERNKINETFILFYDFVEKMLIFRNLEDRWYLGLDVGSRILTDEIINKNKVEDFEDFLNDANVNCTLAIVEEMDKKTLVFNFEGKYIPFTEIYSTGTSALTLFYFWFQHLLESNISFLFIDEFDAFYHHELSALIVEKLKSSRIQFILTTHNTSIITNEVLRPDCYFLMNKEKIKSLSKCTEKELREAHNIEKMYKAGVFYVE